MATRTEKRPGLGFVFVLVLAFISSSLSSSSSSSDVFTNEFVIEVPGGEAAARGVAAENGLRFGGVVSPSLGDYYSVHRDNVEARRRRRVRRDAVGHLERLRRDRRVTYVERQRLLTRVKRGFLPARRAEAEADPDALEDEEKRERNRWRDFDREALEYEGRAFKGDFYRVPQGQMERKRGVRKECPDFNDDNFNDQWYLCDVGQTGGDAGMDLNVVPAWERGIMGAGVKVCVMDDGIDHNHPDLRRNFDFKASWDANGNRKLATDDPVPRMDDPSNDHGTKCAGEIAMEANNGICGVGVAPEAKVGGIRLLDGKITDRLEARAVNFKNEYVDIFSASWGPKDNGETMEAPGRLTSAAFKRAVEKGRDGKGSIFVWASGNGGLHGDDCGADGYVSSIYTISIGSVNEFGLSTYFMEFCPSTMAVVPAGGMHNRDDLKWMKGPRIKVVSTDIFGGCVENFQGTSAAAPLATGCAALTLCANKNLGWRDVQHIIVRSARIPNDEETRGWEINGAGFHINDKFGFGLLDCGKMVQLALNWTNVPSHRICKSEIQEPNKMIPANGSITLEQDVNACAGDDNNRVDTLEHVQLHLVIEHGRRGDLVLRLRSPAGTVSELLSRREHDHHSDIDFTFMTVRKWGEKGRGKWKLEILNKGNLVGKLVSYRIILYGYQTPGGAKHVKKQSDEVASEPSPAVVDKIFEAEREAAETLKLRRVAKVLKQFDEDDQEAILEALGKVKREALERMMKKGVADDDEEEWDEDEEEKRELVDEDIDGLQELISILENSKKK